MSGTLLKRFLVEFYTEFTDREPNAGRLSFYNLQKYDFHVALTPQNEVRKPWDLSRQMRLGELMRTKAVVARDHIKKTKLSKIFFRNLDFFGGGFFQVALFPFDLLVALQRVTPRGWGGGGPDPRDTGHTERF